MLSEYTAYFVVVYYNENGRNEEAGFYPANSLSEAAKYLEEFYGSDLCCITHLELLDTSLIYMKPEVAKQIVDEYYG